MRAPRFNARRGAKYYLVRIAVVLILAMATKFAAAQAAPKINNGTAMVMGGMRGGTMGKPTNVGYSTGSGGLTTTYNQPMRKFPSAANDPHFNPRVTARTPKPGLAKGIKGFLKSPIGRANIYTIVLMWGLEELFERQGFFPEDDGLYVISDEFWDVFEPAEGVVTFVIDGRDEKGNQRYFYYNSIEEACYKHWGIHPSELTIDFEVVAKNGGYNGHCSSFGKYDGMTVIHQNRAKICNPPYVIINGQCGRYKEGAKKLATPEQIEGISFDGWQIPANVPESAITPVYPHISPSDTTIEVASQTIEFPNEITTMPDGTVKETTRRDTATVANPNTDPALVTTTQTTTNTYQDGQMTGSETTTTTTDSTASTPNPGEDPATQSPPLEDIDICKNNKDILACQKVPEMTEPELKVPHVEQTLSFNPVNEFSTSGICPKPRQFSFAFLGKSFDNEISYQPACDFAEGIKPIVVLTAILLASSICFAAVRRL